MCGRNQIPIPVRPHPADQEPKPLEGWDEVDRIIAAAIVLLNGLNEKADGHWTPRGGPG